MLTVGRLNALTVLNEILYEPKSLRDLHQVLVIERKYSDIPMLLPCGLEEFMRLEIRDGTVLPIEDGNTTRYVVKSDYTEAFRSEIEESFAQWREKMVLMNGEHSGRPSPTDEQLQTV